MNQQPPRSEPVVNQQPSPSEASTLPAAQSESLSDDHATEEKREHVYGLVYRLNALRTILTYCSLAAITVNLGNMIFVIYQIVTPPTSSSGYSSSRSADIVTAGLFSGVMLATVLALLLTHELIRKQGDAVFDELSDLLQSGISNSSDADVILKSEARLATRRFTRAADLPLFPGRFGYSVFAALNLSMTVILVLVLRLSAR